VNLTWLPPLLFRLVAGVLFVITGWRAVHALDDVTAYFAELGIPLASANAVLVSFGELICGTLLVVGAASRLAAIPLAIFMIVAIATAKLPAIHGVGDFLMLVEPSLVAMLVAIAIAGPGPISIDAWLARRRDHSPVSALRAR
jgi:putative oxidoreductase